MHNWRLIAPLSSSKVAFWVNFAVMMVTLLVLLFKRKVHPINMILLTLFTLSTSLMVGITGMYRCKNVMSETRGFNLPILVSFYQATIVLQAFIVTLGIFVGLTLLTAQSNYDFSGLGPYLAAFMMALFFTGLLSVYIPFNNTAYMVYCVLGAFLFSMYIIYDTYMIFRRLSPDEYVIASVDLYLDFVNLFLEILRILSRVIQ